MAIFRSHLVPNAAHDFVIFGHTNSYLCADGYGTKLRCQRLQAPPVLATPIDLEVRKAYIQNAVTLLRAPRAVADSGNVKTGKISGPVTSMTSEGGGCSFDDETGECYGGGGGGGGGGDYGGGGGGGYGDTGSGGYEYPYEPIFEPDTSGDPDADALAQQYFPIGDQVLAAEFAGTAANIYGRPANGPEECAAWISACRDTCTDRYSSALAMCGAMGVGIAALPPKAAVLAGVIFTAACAWGANNKVEECKMACFPICAG